MAWFKRNLFFAIAGIISLALLVAAGVYDWKSYSDNSAALGKLNETYQTLKDLAGQKLSAGNAKVNNVDAAREQEQELRDWIKNAEQNFQPISAIPDENQVTSEDFAGALRRTIFQLQREADAAKVILPPDYAFSFTAERIQVRFATGGLGSLAVQLGEVKTISEILYAARILSLDGIQRVRVSEDDVAGQSTDYIEDHSVTNGLAVLTPYVITFRSFSGELAAVLDGLASSPHGFIVKGIDVAPAGAGATQGSSQGYGNPPPYGQPPSGYPPGGYGGFQPPPASPPPTSGGMQTVLDEQLLRVTMEIEIVKLSPGK